MSGFTHQAMMSVSLRATRRPVAVLAFKRGIELVEDGDRITGFNPEKRDPAGRLTPVAQQEAALLTQFTGDEYRFSDGACIISRRGH